MRLLFCSFGTPGFLFPLVGLAHELRARGHEVAFASGHASIAVLEAEGLRRIPRGEKDGDSFHPTSWFTPASCALDAKHLGIALAEHRPHLLVTHHLCLSALIAGERAGLPVAILGPFTYLYPPATPGAADPQTETRLRWRLDDGIRSYNEVRRLFRMDPVGAAAEDHALLGDLFMVRSIPQLERGFASLPHKVRLVGPCTREPGSPHSAADEWAELEAGFALPGAPIVYVNNGRSFGGPNFWPGFVEGLADAPVQVVASAGRMDMEIGPLPPNFLVRGHVPHGLVLPRAGAMAGSSHSAAVIGSLMHGVPGVLFPHGVDTPDNASRMVEAGCAVALDPATLTPAMAREAVERVLADGEMRRRCGMVRDALRQADSFGPAADGVEELGRRRYRRAGGDPLVASAAT